MNQTTSATGPNATGQEPPERRLRLADTSAGHTDPGDPELPDDFDPSSVPVFPRLAIEVSRSSPGSKPSSQETPTSGSDPAPNPYIARLEGQLIDVGEPRGAGIAEHLTDAEWLDHTMKAAKQAAVDLIRSRNYGLCRVNAVDVDGTSWPLILGPNGETYDLLKRFHGSAPAKKQRLHRRSSTTKAIAAVAVAAIVVGGLTVPVVIRHREAVAAAQAARRNAPKPKPIPAEFPILAPAGSSTHARWQYGPIADPSQDGSAAAIAPDGTLWVRTANALARINTSLGRVAWQTALSDSSTGPWIRPAPTTTSGAAAGSATIIVTEDQQTLTWRNLGNLQPHTATIPDNSTMTPLAGGIVVDEPDQHAAILTNQGLVNRLVPAGSSIIGVQGPTLYTASGTQLWAIAANTRQTPNPVTLKAPASGTTPSADSLIWKDGALTSLWTSTDPTKPDYIAFHRADGTLISAEQVNATGAGTTAADQLADPRYTIYGRYLVDHQAHAVTDLPSTWSQTQAITSNEIFGTNDNNQSVTYNLADHTTRTAATSTDQSDPATIIGTLTQPKTTGRTNAPAKDPADVIATAELTDGTHLYRLQPS